MLRVRARKRLEIKQKELRGISRLYLRTRAQWRIARRRKTAWTKRSIVTIARVSMDARFIAWKWVARVKKQRTELWTTQAAEADLRDCSVKRVIANAFSRARLRIIGAKIVGSAYSQR
jgi:hypothetical protein